MSVQAVKGSVEPGNIEHDLEHPLKVAGGAILWKEHQSWGQSSKLHFPSIRAVSVSASSNSCVRNKFCKLVSIAETEPPPGFLAF